MRVTEVRIKIASEFGNSRLVAYCQVAFDDQLAVHDIKLLRNANGLFIAFPSKRLTGKCPQCFAKNALTNRHCHDCGAAISLPQPIGEDGRPFVYADVAHPITQEFRNEVQAAVVAEYIRVLAKEQKAGATVAPAE